MGPLGPTGLPLGHHHHHHHHFLLRWSALLDPRRRGRWWWWWRRRRTTRQSSWLVGGNTRVFFLFLSILWCSQSGDDDPFEEDLIWPHFGYKLINMKLNSWAAYLNHECKHYGDFFSIFGLDSGCWKSLKELEFNSFSCSYSFLAMHSQSKKKRLANTSSK